MLENNERPQVNVDLSAAPTVSCEKCENAFFQNVFVIKKISALVSPNGKEMLAPVQTFQCTSCSHVNDSFDPNKEEE